MNWTVQGERDVAERKKRPIDRSILELDDDERERVARLILTLRRRGIDDRRILGAIEQVPRKLFVSAEDQILAIEDRSLPIECGQTLPAPSVVGLMLKALQPIPGQKILQIGTGSGYTAAVLAGLGAEVITIDRYRTLTDLARERFAALRLERIEAEWGDGLLGWSKREPYDRILVSAALPTIPAVLFDQLKDTGILVAPVGPGGSAQTLTRVSLIDRVPRLETMGEVRFVPAVSGTAAIL